MAETPSTSSENGDSWSETVLVQYSDNRKLVATVNLKTVKVTVGTKEHHVKLSSDDDDCLLYRTVINLDEYKRLAQTNSFIASFDNLPQYIRQLLRAAKQEDEYGQSYVINVVASGALGLVPRIELLITMRHAGQSTQNKVLNLPLTVASDTEFKDFLTNRFEKLKREKEQLRKSASFLESQLRRERERNRELEDKNHWFRKELKFTQNLLNTAQNIQKHYEVILSLRYRGETGSTIVTIGDIAAKPLSDTDAGPSPANSATTAAYECESPTTRKISVAYSQTSDDGSEAKAIKRKVSFDTTDPGSDTDDESRAMRPPPRKFASAVPLFDDRLVRIRREEEQRRSSTRTSDEDDLVHQSDDEDEERLGRKMSNDDVGMSALDDQKSPLLPSPLLPKAMSPPSVLVNEGEDHMAGGSGSSTQTQNHNNPKILECPNDASS